MTKIVFALAFVLSACATTDASDTAHAGRGSAPAIMELMLGSLRGQRGSDAAVGDLMESIRTGVPYETYLKIKARKYATAEARAAAVARNADATLAHFDRLNEAARTMLVENRTEIARLNDSYRSGSLSRGQYQEQLAPTDRKQAALKSQMAALEAEIAAMKAGQPDAELGERLQRLERQRDSLKATYDDLLRLYGTVPAEVRGAGKG